MGVYKFSWCSVFLVLFSILSTRLLCSCGLSLNVGYNLIKGYVAIDGLRYYLALLVLLLGVYCVLGFWSKLDAVSISLLGVRLLFRALCFSVNHSILFWICYELSMLPLLALIFRDSPYSERFIAGWYFSVYLLVTSLPLLMLLLYLSYLNGGCIMKIWEIGAAPTASYIFLRFIFFTKVPLLPFHTWLPIVHAEATRIVSMFLRGYIMKLGLLGVYRCCPFIFKGWFMYYFFFCCVVRVFFILTASRELDGKRWLAFLRLGHVRVALIGFFCCDMVRMNLVFLFCLAHGLRAAMVFGLLWSLYDMSGTRNWLLLKSSITNRRITYIVVVRLLSLCSFPPTLQFFCELGLISQSSMLVTCLIYWCLYLFFGGLVPLILCGHILVRTEGLEVSSYSLVSFISVMSLLGIWCYLGVCLL